MLEKQKINEGKEYNLQAYDKSFKPTPPGFDPEIVLQKTKGEDLLKNG